jgi:N6-L-threonylcarbamoyladenine synthase
MHMKSKRGSDAPSNLITVCKKCHDAHHDGKINVNKTKKSPNYRDEAFMSTMRWAFWNRLKENYPNVKMTYGYITNKVRNENSLAKTYAIDARCIAGGAKAAPCGELFILKFVRTKNRQVHKMNIRKGELCRRNNQTKRKMFGNKLFDKVRLNDGREGFIFGKKSSGTMAVRTIYGEPIKEITHKKLQLLERGKSVITERYTYSSAEYKKARISA